MWQARESAHFVDANVCIQRRRHFGLQSPSAGLEQVSCGFDARSARSARLCQTMFLVVLRERTWHRSMTNDELANACHYLPGSIQKAPDPIRPFEQARRSHADPRASRTGRRSRDRYHRRGYVRARAAIAAARHDFTLGRLGVGPVDCRWALPVYRPIRAATGSRLSAAASAITALSLIPRGACAYATGACADRVCHDRHSGARDTVSRANWSRDTRQGPEAAGQHLVCRSASATCRRTPSSNR